MNPKYLKENIIKDESYNPEFELEITEDSDQINISISEEENKISLI